MTFLTNHPNPNSFVFVAPHSCSKSRYHPHIAVKIIAWVYVGKDHMLTLWYGWIWFNQFSHPVLVLRLGSFEVQESPKVNIVVFSKFIMEPSRKIQLDSSLIEAKFCQTSTPHAKHLQNLILALNAPRKAYSFYPLPIYIAFIWATLSWQTFQEHLGLDHWTSKSLKKILPHQKQCRFFGS